MTYVLQPEMSKKVAWAWLDNLLNRFTKTVNKETDKDAPPALQMTPKEREALLDRSYEQIKSALIQEIKDQIPSIQRLEAQIARKYDLDPLYFNWFLMNSPKWPSMPTKVNMALRALQNTYLWFGEIPDHWNNMEVPDLSRNRDRDRAFQEFGATVLRQVFAQIEKHFADLLWKHGQDLVKKFKGPRTPQDPLAGLLLKKDFKRRLIADRFQLKPSVLGIVQLFS